MGTTRVHNAHLEHGEPPAQCHLETIINQGVVPRSALPDVQHERLTGQFLTCDHKHRPEDWAQHCAAEPSKHMLASPLKGSGEF